MLLASLDLLHADPILGVPPAPPPHARPSSDGRADPHAHAPGEAGDGSGGGAASTECRPRSTWPSPKSSRYADQISPNVQQQQQGYGGAADAEPTGGGGGGGGVFGMAAGAPYDGGELPPPPPAPPLPPVQAGVQGGGGPGVLGWGEWGPAEVEVRPGSAAWWAAGPPEVALGAVAERCVVLLRRGPSRCITVRWWGGCMAERGRRSELRPCRGLRGWGLYVVVGEGLVCVLHRRGATLLGYMRSAVCAGIQGDSTGTWDLVVGADLSAPSPARCWERPPAAPRARPHSCSRKARTRTHHP